MKRDANRVETRGRPALPEGQKRDQRIDIKVTTDEKRQFEALASQEGVSVAELIRRRVLG